MQCLGGLTITQMFTSAVSQAVVVMSENNTTTPNQRATQILPSDVQPETLVKYTCGASNRS
jgi:hypothetical protein